MATKHTCTINLRCWKQHTCVSCGSQFSYLFLRKAVGQASTPEKATVAAEANAQKRLDNDVDAQPCPTCGIYQPEMIGSQRGKSQLIYFWLSVVAAIVLIILTASHAVQDDWFAPCAAATFAAIGLAQFFTDAKRPNRDLAANRQAALSAMQRGILRVDKAGQTQTGLEEPWRAKGSLLGPIAFVFTLAGLLALLAPSVIRESAGWPFNKACYPPVAGPGDSTCFYMKQSVTSIKGYFRGQATASAREGDKGPAIGIAATTKDSDWGQNIQAKSSEKDNTSRLWVTLNLPNKPELAGKELKCNVHVDVAYPKVDASGSTFHVEHQGFDDTLDLHLASPDAGKTYRSIWWFGTLGGMAVFLLAGLLRVGDAGQVRKQGLATAVYNDVPADTGPEVV